MRILVTLLCTLLSLPTLASWKLDNGLSDFNYLTIKKGQVAEINHFKQLKGSISDRGEVLLEINLLSVETNVAIRNERMGEFLFETDMYPKARFITELPKDLIASVKSGNSKRHTLKGIINLHGVIKEVSAEVLISRLSENQMLVSSTKPLLISAQDFNLEKGVAKLKELAQLPSIMHTVPVNFNLTFKQ